MITKRQKILATCLILAGGLFFVPSLAEPLKNYFIAGLVVTSFLLSFWSIYGKFSWLDIVNLFVLPAIFTSSFALFLGGFETSVETRVVLALVYVAVMYTILLSENIFFVSTERNIPLVRAARTIGYLATLFVSFAFFTLLFGLRLNLFIFAGIVFLVAILIIAQGLWQINLKDTDIKNQIIASLVSGFIVAQVALAFSFWPLDPPRVGLAITASIYVLLGVLQHQIREDLNRRSIVEYVFVSLMVIFLLFATTSWGA